MLYEVITRGKYSNFTPPPPPNQQEARMLREFVQESFPDTPFSEHAFNLPLVITSYSIHYTKLYEYVGNARIR